MYAYILHISLCALLFLFIVLKASALKAKHILFLRPLYGIIHFFWIELTKHTECNQAIKHLEVIWVDYMSTHQEHDY